MSSPKTGGNAGRSTNGKTNGNYAGGINANGSVKDPVLVGILFAVIAVFLTIMYFYIRNKKKGRSILIVGSSEVGKTALFLRLGFNKNNMETVTSTSPNITDFDVNGKAPLIIKDLPGHEKIRQKYWELNRIGVRGIIFVVDAAGGSKSIREAAEVLYDVLTDSIVSSVKPNLLIFCNKQDLPTTKSSKVIRLQLEREITTLRLTRSASLKSISGNPGSPGKMLGKADRDFDFDQILPLKVEFAEGVATGEETEIESVNDWLNSVA